MTYEMMELFSKPDNFYLRYLTGKSIGRRWKVWDYFRMHFQNLGSIARNLFYYDGYDDHELFKEIEKRFFYFGRCGIVQKSDKLIAVNANGFQPGIYGRPEKFTFTFYGGVPDNYVTPNQRVIGENGAFGFNTFDGYPTALIVEHYALMLAHCDTSITMEMVNGRMMDVITASDNRGKEAATAYTKKIYDGDYSFIEDRSENLEINRASASRTSRLRELCDTKEKLMHDIYAAFGVNRVPEKAERLITTEAEGSGAMLVLNIKDMLEMREKFVEDINNVFDTNISVKCHIDIDADGTLEHTQEAEHEQPAEPEKGEDHAES